jgi:hypothetical protein
MAGSSRNFDFPAKTTSEAESFFIQFVESWRIAMGGITNFILMGHSLVNSLPS